MADTELTLTMKSIGEHYKYDCLQLLGNLRTVALRQENDLPLFQQMYDRLTELGYSGDPTKLDRVVRIFTNGELLDACSNIFWFEKEANYVGDQMIHFAGVLSNLEDAPIPPTETATAPPPPAP